MPQSDTKPSVDKMLSFAPTPIFSGVWDHRPAVSSPLSSSPVRASSPLSPIDKNAFSCRQTQSSPIKPPNFKFASRPTRPNPVVRKREEAQESRRRLFLQNVRQKSDDKAWQRRDVEGQFLKTNFFADKGHLTHDAPEFTEADIEDAMAFQQEQFQEEPEQPEDEDMFDDDVMDEVELEAMLSQVEQQSTMSQRPPSPSLSDDDYDDYDDIFAELIAQEQSLQQRNHCQPMEEIEMSDEMEMSQ